VGFDLDARHGLSFVHESSALHGRVLFAIGTHPLRNTTFSRQQGGGCPFRMIGSQVSSLSKCATIRSGCVVEKANTQPLPRPADVCG
jgi:hypothetical protein